MALLDVAIAFDQLCNTLLAGKPDETISARAYRNKDCGKRRWSYGHAAINLIFFWQPFHCYHSFLAEVNRKQLPESYQ